MDDPDLNVLRQIVAQAVATCNDPKLLDLIYWLSDHNQSRKTYNLRLGAIWGVCRFEQAFINIFVSLLHLQNFTKVIK